MPSRKASFKNRFSFYLLAIGSACGIGNLWRFPYIVGENGGGAFLLLYVFLALTVGLSLMIAELMIGRYTGSSIVAAARKTVNHSNGKYIQYFGWLSLIISVVTLAYYSVISGWVLHYMTQFTVSLLQEDSVYYLKNISVITLLQNGWLQFLLASVHLLVSLVIVVKGFGEDVEKRITSLLPLFAVLVVFLLMGSLSLDSTPNVLRFLFYPDFSKLNWSSLGHAIGHVFFTLSLGFGTMVTFGSYFKNEDHLPTIGVRVTVVDTIVSIIAVLLIFPIAFSSSKQIATDPSLVFDVLPTFLSSIRGGILFGLIFFLFLWLAALNASIGLLETITANITEKKPDIKRPVAATFTVLIILTITVFPAFSNNFFSNIKIFNRSVIEFFDSTLINILLPIAVLGMGLIFFKVLPESEQKKMFIQNDISASVVIQSHWRFILKWIVPVTVVSGLLMLFIGFITR